MQWGGYKMVTYKDMIKIVYGTIGKDVNLQARDDNGDGVSLSTCTIIWVVYEPEATTPVLEVTCNPVDLVLGKVSYTLRAEDWGTNKLQSSKDYTSSLIATKENYRQEFKRLKVRILPKTPVSA